VRYLHQRAALAGAPDAWEPANLTVHMSALRRTLRDGRDGNRFIINVPGRGYSFVASVEVSERAN
jgi:DNA-binding winged helix-turn-helix (wHTH) protein